MDQSKNVLVIEDEELIRESLQLALESEGYHVQTAQNGAEGLDLLKNQISPCVILLDLMMPVMNGWQFLDELSKKNDTSKIPVVVVSAFVNERPLKVKFTLPKPLDLDDLFHAVEECCREDHCT